MITVKNILSEYPKIDQSVLPAQLRKSEFVFIEENIDLYGADETIDEYIDKFIAGLNQYAGKGTTSRSKTRKSSRLRKGRTAKRSTAKTTKSTRLRKGRKKSSGAAADEQPAPKRSRKPGRKPNAKPDTKVKTPRAKKEDNRTVVAQKPEWLQTIRQFIAMSGKKRTVTSVSNFVKKIQFEFQANPHRKPTPHIQHIRYIQDILIKAVNGNLYEKHITVSVPDYKLKAIKAVASQYVIKKSNHKRGLSHQPLSGVKKKMTNPALSARSIW
jgi:hypothetical protein